MTTTPTASPELPDLDRLEALARAATPGDWLMHDTYACNGELSGYRIVAEDGYELIGEDAGPGAKDAEFIAAANPAAVLALIALARRAKPEGEAPQAAPVATFIKKGALRPWMIELIGTLPDGAYSLILAPAAQHAESGAQAAGTNWDEVIDLIADELEAKSNLLEISLFTSLCEEFDRRGAPIAAKAEAPAADELTEDDKRLVARSMERWRKGVAGECRLPPAGWHCTRTPGHDGPCAAHPAQQAEAPADDPYALEDDDEVRFPNDTQVAIVSAKRYYELRGFEERAQQAAAPGALAAWFDAEQKRLDAVTAYNAAVLVSEREVWPGRDINPEYQAMNAAQNAEFHARGALFASRAAPSAPGTPEAPAKRGDAKDAARYRWLRDHHIGDDPGAINLEPAKRSGLNAAVDAAMRAAQLDGGQGEGVGDVE